MTKKTFEISNIQSTEELNHLSLKLNEKEQVSHIKIGKDVAQDDLLDRLARRVDGRVRPAGVGTLTHLRARQALLRVGVRDGHVPPLRRFGRGRTLVFDFFDQIGQRSASRMRIPNIIAFRAMEWNNSL